MLWRGATTPQQIALAAERSDHCRQKNFEPPRFRARCQVLTVATPSLSGPLRIWAWTIWITGFALAACTLSGYVVGVTIATAVLMSLLCPWVALFGWKMARTTAGQLPA